MTETTSPTPCKCGMTPYITGNFEMGYKVFCPNTGCDLDAYATGSTEDEAIAAWNRRAAPSPAPAAPSAAQWMPMDSAPDDGTLFLAAVHVQHNETKEEWWEQHIIARDDETGDVHTDHYQGWDWGDYSHWMPLPAAPGAQPSQGGSVSEAAAEIDEDDIAALMAWKYACTTRQASPDRDTMTEWWDRLDDWEKCGFREGAVAAMSALSAARAAQPMGEEVEALKPKADARSVAEALGCALPIGRKMTAGQLADTIRGVDAALRSGEGR